MGRCFLLISCLLIFCVSFGQSITPAGPTGFCPGGSVTLIITGAPVGSTFKWYLNAVQLTGSASTYNANQAGTYTAVVTRPVTGDITLNAVTVNAYPAPTAGFSFSPGGECSNVPVGFTDLSSGTGLTYLWNFSDPTSGSNNVSSLANPVHSFIGTSGGGTQSFPVTLTVTNSEGCTSSVQKPVTTKQLPGTQLNGPGPTTYNGKPYFKICATTASQFTFTNISSTIAANASYTIIWGDGQGDFNANSFTSTPHTYNVGTYTLQFIVRGNNGCADTGTYYVFVGRNPQGGINSPGSTVGCTGETFSFPFGNISGNAPGTEYYIYVNDGVNTDTVKYTQANVPAVFTHVFDNTSCGVAPNNTFTISYLFANPCGETPGTIGGIRISKKAAAAFSIAPKDTVCQNTTVTFTNTGSAGTIVPDAGSAPCTAGKLVWQISPATGWSRTGGNLGSDNSGSPDVDSWMPGSTAIGINFTVPGTYTVKLKGGTNRCGIDSIVKTICVNPPPTGSFTLDKLTGCASPSLTVNGTASTNTPFCGINKFSWRVSYTPTSGCVPAVRNVNYINGTDSTSAQPVFQFHTPGVYSISLVIYAPASTCSTATASQQVVVKGKPNVSFTVPASVCQNLPVTHTEAATCNMAGPPPPTYLWTITGGTVASSNTLNPGTVIFTAQGNQTLTLTVTNECGSTALPQTVAVNPVPDINGTNNIVVCPGTVVGPLTFTSSLSGTAFSWMNNNTGIGLPSGGNGATINSFTATNSSVSPITATVTVTAAKNGCTASQTFTVTVNPRPPIPTVTSPVTYCQNATASSLTASVLSGHSLLWYTTTTGGTGSPIAPTPITTATGSTVYYVSQVNAITACESNRVSIAVIVNPSPTITAIPTNPTSCGTATGKIVISGLTAGSSYTINYTKNGTPVSPFTQTAASGGTVTLSNLTAGTYDNITVTSSGCASNAAGPFTLSDPNPPPTPTATANGPICAGNALLLGTSAVSGATYTWSGPNGFSSSQQNPSIANATIAATGTYSVTVTVSGCASAAGTVAAVVNPTPAMPTAASNSPLCIGDNLTLTASTSYTGAVTWLWTGPNGFTSTQQNPTLPNVTAAEAGNYAVMATATAGGCASLPKTVAVVINPTPVIASVSATNPSNCNTATGSIALNGLAANTSYTVSYTKNGTPVTATVTTNASGVLVINGLTSGVYDNIKVARNGCSSNGVGPYTLVDPNLPATPVVTGNSPVCSGGTLNLNASTAANGAITWSWTGPNGFTSTSSSPFINNVSVAASGTYSVTATVTGCTSAAGTLAVVVNPTPAAPGAAYNGPICSGGTVNLTASTATAGATMYAWTGPNGYTSTQQNPAITNATASASGNYTVTATQGTCSSPPSTIQVAVHPELTNLIDTATQTVCSNQPVTVNGVTAAGGIGAYTYQWEQSTDNVNWAPVAGQTGASLSLTPIDSTYLRRKVSSGPCQSVSLSVYIAVQPPVVNNILQQDAAICINTTAATVIGSVPAGANAIYIYQWEQSTNGGATWTAVAGATAKDYAPGVLTATTKYRRIVTTSLCSGPYGSTSNVITITVNPDAKALFVPTDTLKCPPFAITAAVVNLQASPANGQYIWYANGVQIGTGTTFPGYTLANENDSVIIKLKVISAYGCQDDSLLQKFKTIRKPTPSFTMTDTVGCGPLTVSFTNGSTYLTSYNYFWDFGNGQTSSQVQPGSIGFAPNPAYGDTTYTVKLNVFSPCDTQTYAKTIRVKSGPKALFTPTKTVGCSPMTVKFKNTSKGTNNTYFWDFGDGTALSTATPDTVQHTFISGVVDTFYVKLKAVNDCGADSLMYSIVVAPNSIRLNLAVNGTEHFGCAPHAVSFINNSQGASLFLWNFGDGANTTTAKNVDTVRHTYLTPGTYTVALRAVNNCSDTTTTETIVVYPTPRAQFTANTFNVCIGDSVKFANGSDSATACLWKFGDGLTSTLNNPSHAYTTAGTYAVTLVAYRNNPSGNVCADSAKQTITVSATQTGFFTVSDSVSSCAPATVTMINRNRPSVSALWDFGDGATASGDSVTHTYQTAGTYVVKLTVKVPGGCTYVSTKTVTVAGPKGELQYAKGYVCGPSPVQLRVAATGATSYAWDFGDGTTLTTAQPTVYHTYANPGYYLPKVTLANGSCGVLLKGLDTIKVDNVDGGFRWVQTQSCGTTTLTFTDTSHVFFGAQSIQWNFGDNTTGTGSNPSHSYAASGTYAVQMIVQGKSGCADTVSTPVNVTIKSKPIAGINAKDTGCTQRSLAFNALVQTVDPVNFIQWNVSNGAGGTGAVFTYTFTTVGTYTVRLVVGTTTGCYDTAYHTVRINPSPAISATPSLTLCRGATAPLNATGAATWQWLPLSGLSCYNCPDPIASPTVTTPYVVEGRDGSGCAGYDTVVVTVIQPLKMTVSPDDSVCTGSSVNLLASGASSYNWSPGVGLNSTAISNPTASPTVTTRYRVVGYDGYNCFTDTAFVTVAVGRYPTVSLGPDLTLPAGTLYPLATTVTSGPIRNWLWTPTTDLSCAACALPVAEIKKDITYTVKVTSAYGCSASDTINIKVSCAEDQVYVPNAFSPDGDGLNDVFMVRGRGIARVTYFRVFNRWGEMVFEAANFKPNDPKAGWDGRVKGKAGGSDVFVYTWEAVCENGAVFSGKGNVSLIK